MTTTGARLHRRWSGLYVDPLAGSRALSNSHNLLHAAPNAPLSFCKEPARFSGIPTGLLNIQQGFQQGYSTFNRDFNRVTQHSAGISTGLLNIQQGFQQGYSTFSRDFNRVGRHSTRISNG
jgi:hypothetical protein